MMKTLAAAWLACCLGAGSAGAADSTGSSLPADAEHQVLVLLNLPPAHFRPDGNYASGYADAAGSSTRRRIAAALARSNGLSLATDWPLPILGVDCYVMDVPPPRRADEVAARLAHDPRVAWAQPMNVYRSLGHDDPLFGLQPAAREWHLGEIHEIATGREVRVAVIDSGVQLDHPDLVGQVALNANFVGNREYLAEIHGTAVAGIIAARADNHVGIVGVAPQARLLALRSCWQATPADTLCTTLSLALALHTAIERGAQVINMSLSGQPTACSRRWSKRHSGAASASSLPPIAPRPEVAFRPASAASSPSSTRARTPCRQAWSRRPAPTCRRACPIRAGLWCRALPMRQRMSVACSP